MSGTVFHGFQWLFGVRFQQDHSRDDAQNGRRLECWNQGVLHLQGPVFLSSLSSLANAVSFFGDVEGKKAEETHIPGVTWRAVGWRSARPIGHGRAPGPPCDCAGARGPWGSTGVGVNHGKRFTWNLSTHVGLYTRTFQEVSINRLLVVKGCPKTTCWKVLVEESESFPKRSMPCRFHSHLPR